jgi:hypothetical protein
MAVLLDGGRSGSREAKVRRRCVVDAESFLLRQFGDLLVRFGHDIVGGDDQEDDGFCRLYRRVCRDPDFPLWVPSSGSGHAVDRRTGEFVMVPCSEAFVTRVGEKPR